MRVHFLFENPKKIEATLKITMTIEEWETLRDQLVSSHPSWRLSSAITDLLAQARRILYPATPEEDLPAPVKNDRSGIV